MDDGTRRCMDCDAFLRRLVEGRGRWPLRCAPCHMQNERVRDRARYEQRAGYVRAKSNAWYAANRGRVSTREKARRDLLPEMFRERSRTYAAKNAEAARRRARSWAKENPDRRREQWAKRKALKLGNGHEPYSRAEIFERDNWTCQLCGDPLDMTAKSPAPFSPSIDHVVPLVKGGPDTPANVQAAHLVCNCRKNKK